MRRSASEIIRNLELRIARLERQSKEKTLFERSSRSQIKKVHEIFLSEMLDPDNQKAEFDRENLNAGYEGDYTAGMTVRYKVPLRPICKLVSKIFKQKVSREDLQPFLDDFYPKEMNIDGVSPDKFQRSGFDYLYTLQDFGDYFEEYGDRHDSNYGVEIEIEDVDGDYLLANAYISFILNYP